METYLDLVHMKRDQNRVSIRRQEHEKFFSKKRNTFKDNLDRKNSQSTNQWDFPNGFPQNQVDLCFLIPNVDFPDEEKRQSLKDLNEFFLDEKNRDLILSQMNIFKKLTESLITHIDYDATLISQVLVNVTFYFNAQIIKSINGWEHLNLLLSYEGQSPRDSYLTILANLLVELEEGDQLLLSEKLQIIESVCGSLKAHGGDVNLHVKSLNLISQLLVIRSHADYERVVSFLFDIHDNCTKSEVMKACFRCFASLMNSYMSDVDKGALLAELKCFDFNINGAHKLRAITSFIEYEPIGKRAMAEWVPFMLSLAEEQRTIYDIQLIRELFNLGCALDIKEIDSYRLLLDDLVKMLIFLNKYEAQSVPSSVCRFMAQMAEGPHFKKLVVEVPVIQLFHRAMAKRLPIPLDQYLVLMKAVISYGEQVEPQKYIGCFIHCKGEDILNHYDNEQQSASVRKLIDELRDILGQEK